MKQIAKALNAKLMGDDGEIYDLDSEKIIKDEYVGAKVKPNKPWWKFWE
jgi:hypothetical protein